MYNPELGIRALILIQLLQTPYVKDLVKRLKRNPCLKETYGYGDIAPTEAHFSQMKRRIWVEGFRAVEALMLAKYLRGEKITWVPRIAITIQHM